MQVRVSMLPLAEGLVLSAAAHVSLRGMIHTQESFMFLTALDKSISPHMHARAHTYSHTKTFIRWLRGTYADECQTQWPGIQTVAEL